MGSERKKKEIFELIEAVVAVQLGVMKSGIGNIRHNRSMILKAWKESCSSRRKQIM
jgi:hypothetical protein